MSSERELDLLRFLDGLYAQLKATRDASKAQRHAVRAARDFLGAGEACLAVARPGDSSASILIDLGGAWDFAMLGAFIRNERPSIPPDLVVAPVRRRGRAWAAIALRRTGVSPEDHAFEGGAIRMLLRIAAAISECIELLDRERILEVRDQIDRKIMGQLRPQDLFYEILHGLRSLTRYDHTSAILMRDDGDGVLRLVAEQIAWKKGKSRRIGQKFSLTPGIVEAMGRGIVYGFERSLEAWEPLTPGFTLPASQRAATTATQATAHVNRDENAIELAKLLDYNNCGPADEPRESAILCAPLSGRDGIFGVLKIAACHRGAFGAYEADLVERFRSQAAIAIQILQRAESLQSRMIEAEKKHAMADLARSVAHDVNNALGAVLPIVQQIRQDARLGVSDPVELAADVEEIEKSLQVVRRIFGGMLAFARGGSRRTSDADLRLALDGTLAILRDGFERRGVAVTLEILPDLPRIAGGQSDLEQILLNLLTNAKDAMPRGGSLSVRARVAGDSSSAGAGPGAVEITIEDTGMGIRPEDLARVAEPFFTTKPEGTGLGLATCRSIVWEMGGKMTIESTPGKGTRVAVVVPAVPSMIGTPRATKAKESGS